MRLSPIRSLTLALLSILGLVTSACSPSEKATAPEPQAQAATVVLTAPEGETVPQPVFQRGDELAKPLAEGSDGAKDFVTFFNATYMDTDNQIPLLSKQDVVWFPPQALGDTSLQAVHRGVPGTPASDCDDPSSYPIVCADDFSSSEFCQACHDNALFVTGGGLPAMTYYSEGNEWLANWTQYGDWSASIMALATRDPVWQAQIETETAVHDGVDPNVIEDICFRCHGAMGERQLQTDHGEDAHFCTDVFYATIPGIVPAANRGEPYPFSEHCAPLGQPVNADMESQKAYAKYGALARDGVSCEVCHRLGPPGASGVWDGEDFMVFYGPEFAESDLGKQANDWPLTRDFTATFEYDMTTLMTPDKLDDLDAAPMKDEDYLDIAQAVNTKDHVSYLRQSVLCGSCHVLIVPKIPTNYRANAPLPDPDQFPYYAKTKPPGCTSSTFASDANPVTDPCVAVSYEQATYLEWINSEFATEGDTDTTCQGCHMPFVTNPDNPLDHGAIMAQATPDLTPKQYRRHRMMGINLFVFEMFAQFPDVLGVDLNDARVPEQGTASDGTSTPYIRHNLLNGEMSIVQQATSQANGNGLDPATAEPTPQASAEITIDFLSVDDSELKAELTVFNNTGHKFPSGAGFRRAFLRFEVLDSAGTVLWVSGATNPFGAICDGPCQETAPGKYNLLKSETPGTDPGNLQPHYATITSESQVQIYEVQDVDDSGELTSSTLALFWDAKDNRILPRGWTSPKDLGCEENANAVPSVFGISKCSAADGTEPQYEPLTKGSAIATDPYYSDSSLTGADKITYQVPVGEISGQPASVRVTMQYQTIPPNYLAARFKDGSEAGSFLPATKREIYLTSHLDTDLGLTSTHPDNPGLPLTDGWTMSLYQATQSVN